MDNLKRFDTCDAKNKEEHFIRIENFMNKTLPMLEYLVQHKDTLDKKHQELLPKALEHFKTYRADKQALQKECMEISLEQCCEKIHVLEEKFYSEIATWNSE
jgi:hypothetical protein